jgi:hypothetical protein
LVGRLREGPQQGDFTIFEDGKPQEIRYFAREVDTPLTVALMLDSDSNLTTA